MDLNYFTLTFAPELEERYVRDTYHSGRSIMRLLLFLGAIMYAVFGLLDLLILPEHIATLYFIRFALVLPVILLVYGLSFTPIFERWGQILMAFSVLVSALGIIVMTLITPALGREMYYIGLLLVLFFNYILRIRFVLATLIGWLIVVFYLLSVIFVPGVQREVMWSHLFFIIAINSVGMFAAYSIEFFMRNNYIFSLELDTKNQKVIKMNEELEEKVLEKTLTLKQDIERRKIVEIELVDAKEKAEESERLKTAFLNNMSHEVRTPMNGIMGFAEMLGHVDPKSDKFKKYLSVLKISANRLMNTVDDLIAISKVQTGQVDLQMSRFDLSELLIDEVSLYREMAKQKQIDVLLETCQDEPLLLYADRPKFKFIISSLVKNAIYFTDKGSVALFCDRTEQELCIHIKDTGIGIPRDRQEAIFRRFEKADLKDVNADQGAGLGLSLSLAYAHKMQGDIRVESEFGQGATFSLLLPLSVVVRD